MVNRLEPIFEKVFDPSSFGYRKGHKTADALSKIWREVEAGNEWMVDADLKDYFDSVSQEWLVRLVEHRIGDKRIVRLIRKWLRAGVLEEGTVTVSEKGTGQGSVISPLLANIYLHYVFDLWAERWRRREARGDMIIVRYADGSGRGLRAGGRRPALPGGDA